MRLLPVLPVLPLLRAGTAALALWGGVAIAQEGMRGDARDAAPGRPVETARLTSRGACAPAFAKGRCRAVIADQGFEHVSSQLWLEWLQPRAPGGLRRVARVRVHELSGGFWVLRPEAPGRAFAGHRLRLSAVHTYSQEEKRVTVAFGRPGRYTLIEESRP